MSLPWRPDLEGLRALAILLVVADHAGVPGLSGGFIGVDLFFVLSGYLISGQLLPPLQTGGALAVGDFYARRLRRLLPLLLVVIAATCGLAWLFYPPGDLPRQAISAAAASLWLSNLHFAFGGMDYFGADAAQDLLLHTWSLGVEEQFYLAWPALLWVLARLPLPGTTATQRLRGGLWALCLGGAAACLATAAHEGLVAFYLMPLRAWQFALGALLWLHAAPAGARQAEGAGALGLALVLAAAVALDERSPYPSPWALLPTLGAALLVQAGRHAPARGVPALLSARPMQALGQISYAWYLWHWPVLLLGAAVLHAPGLSARLALALLALVLALASQRLVEQPIRRSGWLRARPGTTLLLALVLMGLAHLGAIELHNRALARTQEPAQRLPLQVRTDVAPIYALGCDDWYHSATVNPCRFGAPTAPHTAVLIGDSIGLQWFPALAAVLDRPDWQLVVLTKSSCPMVDAPLHYARIGREYTECAAWRQAALDEIARWKPALVLVGSAASYDFTATEWTEGTARVLAPLAAAAVTVRLLRATPVLPFDAPTCLAPRSALYDWLSGGPPCEAPAADASAARVHGWQASAAARFANVRPLDLNEAVCPGGQCRARLGGLITYRDRQHLSASFAASLAPALAQQLSLPPPDAPAAPPGAAAGATR